MRPLLIAWITPYSYLCIVCLISVVPGGYFDNFDQLIGVIRLAASIIIASSRCFRPSLLFVGVVHRFLHIRFQAQLLGKDKHQHAHKKYYNNICAVQAQWAYPFSLKSKGPTIVHQVHRKALQEGRKEGTCLFDINNHTEYTTVKLCRETPTKAQSVPLSREPPTCHNT